MDHTGTGQSAGFGNIDQEIRKLTKESRDLPIADFAIDDRLPYSRFIGAVSACGRFDANEQWHPLISEFQIGSLKLSKPTN